MKGILNYSEYNCPCGGRTERRKVDVVTLGFWRKRNIFRYYYECMDCDIISNEYEADITHKFK